MTLSDEIKDRVLAALRDRFDARLVRNIRLDSVEIDDDEGELRLVFTIEMVPDADAGEIGRRYFGLTDQVRTALGNDWRGYFPILRPRIELRAA